MNFSQAAAQGQLLKPEPKNICEKHIARLHVGYFSHFLARAAN